MQDSEKLLDLLRKKKDLEGKIHVHSSFVQECLSILDCSHSHFYNIIDDLIQSGMLRRISKGIYQECLLSYDYDPSSD